PKLLLTFVLLFSTTALATEMDVADYHPGAIVDRKTGESLRMKCLDSACARGVFHRLDAKGNLIGTGRTIDTPESAEEIIRLFSNELPQKPIPYVLTRIFFGLGDVGALVLFPATVVLVTIDTLNLPFQAFDAVERKLFLKKLQKAFRKKIKIAHRRFEALSLAARVQSL